jgi:PTH1 family peptidyl-tRNA hydrolase
MFVIACLGNPGKKYIKNRHNAGFILGEYLARQFKISIAPSAFHASAGKGLINTIEVLFLFPQDFMNVSGGSVRMAIDYYKVQPVHLVVLHDEIELPLGVVKKKFGGGHKGHNGIRAIINEIGTPDFHRIRIGVGRPDNPDMAVADHVLSNFTKEELIKIQESTPVVSELLFSIITDITV